MAGVQTGGWLPCGMQLKRLTQRTRQLRHGGNEEGDGGGDGGSDQRRLHRRLENGERLGRRWARGRSCRLIEAKRPARGTWRGGGEEGRRRGRRGGRGQSCRVEVNLETPAQGTWRRGGEEGLQRGRRRGRGIIILINNIKSFYCYLVFLFGLL